MTASSTKILTPFDIGELKLNNRLAVAPMTRISATEDGNATETMERYYARFAKGGFGLVITEGIYTDQKFSQGYAFQSGITDGEQARAWRAITDRVHGHQGAIFAQLMHAGALSQANRFSGKSAAPSAVRPKGQQMPHFHGEGHYAVPETMTDEDIADAINGFAQAAKLAVSTAGFDGIEIHGANGYLLDQFLTDYTNQRTDRWGGSLQHRITLIQEVIKAVRAVAGNAPVGVRISQGKVNDYQHKWADGETAAEAIFGSLADATVDFIHVTEYEAWKPAFSGSESTLIALARRYASGVPLIANGGLHTPQHAEFAFNDGADIIALGKAALANPDYPAQLAAGHLHHDFDASVLGPVANIKDSELAFG